MLLKDLDNILAEYLKHFGKDKMSEYFKNLIKIKNDKHREKNATSKKKT